MPSFLSGGHEWRWTAHFEARPWSGIEVNDLRVDADGRPSFRTGPRSTRTLGELAAEIGPIDYPDSYASPARFVGVAWTGVRDPAAPGDPDRVEWYCDTCSFRPWIDFGEAERAELTFVSGDGSRRRVPAALEDGRWVAAEPLAAGERAVVQAGAVRDRFGNYNGRKAG